MTKLQAVAPDEDEQSWTARRRRLLSDGEASVCRPGAEADGDRPERARAPLAWRALLPPEQELGLAPGVVASTRRALDVAGGPGPLAVATLDECVDACRARKAAANCENLGRQSVLQFQDKEHLCRPYGKQNLGERLPAHHQPHVKRLPRNQLPGHV